ncbi:hypothetical protein QTN47_17095 [Danxiaibacter flavus]|uniref:Uncharacterized protein n=1 Tax=Danxiaibacter flavus TaxID=3049108 RepID=A0ABV3ZH45_9BACT|nr:hypothetical protein QNM32_17105 [Chitinophagaceae bacterium DXS]
MATNVFVGPNSVVATKAALMTELGLTDTNCLIAFKTTTDGYKSWQPGREINAFNSIAKDDGLILIMLQDLDLTEFFAPPIIAGSGDSQDYEFIDMSDENI